MAFADKTFLKVFLSASISLTILWCNSTFAQGRSFQLDAKTTVCERYKNIFFVSLETPVAANCETFDSFDRWISEMSTMSISSAQPFLGSIVASNFEGWNWGAENWFAGSIEVYFKPDDAAWNKAQKYIFAHEMGHLFLQAYISDKSKLFAKLLALQKQSFQYSQYLLPILALKSADPSCNDSNSACGRKISAMVASSPVDLSGPSGDQLIGQFQLSNKVQVDRFLEIIPPYHELFADVFEALYADDPEINNKAFQAVGFAPEACRSFSEKLGDDFRSDDAHCSFSSIRAELWQNVVIPSLSEKRTILAKLADAIWEEVQPQLESTDKPLEPRIAAKNLLSRVMGSRAR